MILKYIREKSLVTCTVIHSFPERMVCLCVSPSFPLQLPMNASYLISSPPPYHFSKHTSTYIHLHYIHLDHSSYSPSNGRGYKFESTIFRLLSRTLFQSTRLKGSQLTSPPTTSHSKSSPPKALKLEDPPKSYSRKISIIQIS